MKLKASTWFVYALPVKSWGHKHWNKGCSLSWLISMQVAPSEQLFG